ncbi:MAG: hypothetical protein HY462_01820 [Parcubacteria group bacterium]|nr:hypothetical protein [Parcubacteria group bacterium]
MHNCKGITLIDLILWMAIFGMLTGTMVANFRHGSRNESVRLAASLAASTLRRAQTMTLTGAVLADGDFPNGGYGVRFDAGDTDALTLFADIDGDFAFDAGEELLGQPLPGNAEFSLGGTLFVLFTPPEGDVLFNGAAAPDTYTIPFVVPNSEVVKNVVVYRISGQVREE